MCKYSRGRNNRGDTSSASFYRSDSSFHFPAASTFILCYLFALYYTFSVTLKCFFFSENNKNRAFLLGFYY
ncbi:hypothetical protein CMV37_15575 [Bacillus cereus]|nr:hypothetical protein CMV37_15575 [Bacillus cereus]